MPDTMWNDSPSLSDVRSDNRRSRLLECAHYCRRLARQSDRPEATRSLAVLAGEFEAQAAVVPSQRDELDCRVAAEWHI